MSKKSRMTELYVEPFIGWRGWNINNRGRLCAVNSGWVWEPGEEVRALCSHGHTHRSPDKGCECGLYATKTFQKLQSNGYHVFGAFGQVRLWGRIIDTTMGFRAEIAYPHVIYLPYSDMRWVEPLSVYGVPVMLKNPYEGIGDKSAMRNRGGKKWTLARPSA